ncbi:hypothetical protein ACK2J6_001225 [Vibrio fluvialis]
MTKQNPKAAHAPIEEHPNYEAFIRALWRRIEPYKNNYGKELPSPLPVEFTAHIATAGMLLQESLCGLPDDSQTDD